MMADRDLHQSMSRQSMHIQSVFVFVFLMSDQPVLITNVIMHNQ